MVERNLSKETIDTGKRILEKLDAERLDIRSAFWFYLSDLGKWRLLFATPLVKSKGPKLLYTKTREILTAYANTQVQISLDDVSFIEHDHDTVKIISMMIGCVKGINEVRFSNNTINGHFIEDALIYRLNYTPPN